MKIYILFESLKVNGKASVLEVYSSRRTAEIVMETMMEAKKKGKKSEDWEDWCGVNYYIEEHEVVS